MNFIIENFKNPKAILIVSGLIAVIVFSVMLVGYESYLRTTLGSSCTDSDGGKDYYKKGTVTLSDGTKLTDYCMTGGYKDNVMEYWCNSDGHGMGNFSCPNSCKNGACVKGTTPPPTCTDSDGGINVMKKGTATDNSHSYTDYCVGNSIVEYYCRSGVAKRASTSPSGYSCSRYGQNMICKNGACVKGEPEPTCEADGKCKSSGCPTGDPDCSCEEQNGYICNGYIGETCPGTSLLNNYEGLLEQNFCCSVACAPAAIYSISGQIISDDENYPISGIEVSLSGDTKLERIRRTVDANGNYSFVNLANGSYIVTPSDNTWTFSPTSQNTTISSSNVSGINFTAIKKECNSGETKKHTCPDGTEVDWCTCENYKWACIDSPENNCPATCEADGKCKTSGCPNGDPDCSCSEYEPSGFICQTNETCPGISLTHSGSGICCSIACETGDVTCVSADLNCDGTVNTSDFGILLSWWNQNPTGFTCCQNPDINGDGTVNTSDMGIILSCWDTPFF